MARSSIKGGRRRSQAQFHSAVTMQRSGRLREAEAEYRRLLSRVPTMAEAHSNLGALLNRSGRQVEAVEHLERATVLSPGRAQTFKNLGDALASLGRNADAADAYREAIRLDPAYAGAYSGLGAALFQARQLEPALESYARALDLNPGDPEAVMNAAAVLGRLGLTSKASSLLGDVIVRAPELTAARYNLALCRRDEGRLEEAIHELDRALRMDPDMIDAEFERAQIRLLSGDFERGWREYECRRRHPTCDISQRSFDRPLWDGGRLTGKTILVYEEQGLGDALQFARFIPMLGDRAEKVVMECRAATRRLFEDLPGIDELVVRGERPPAYDVRVPLMSLPFLLGVRLDSIPSSVPYLLPRSGSPANASRASSRRVGIVWAGSPHHGNDCNRSARFDDLAPLLEVDGIELCSLQKGPAVSQLSEHPSGGQVAELGSSFDDLHDTAEVIETLDLVVSVDTAVAHLAGAMGKPVWILLAHSPEWRWLRDRADTPWYPTARLFRQSAPRDWTGLVAAVAHALREWP